MVLIYENKTKIDLRIRNHLINIRFGWNSGSIRLDADANRIRQVLFNILNNAIKFSKPQGIVNITARKEGDMVHVSVSDTGIGIKEADMERLFKEFEQLDKGVSRQFGGTGLGLVISKKLIELHGGRIWVKSKYGEGSTFSFMLPLKKNSDDISNSC